jgi:hypothetical protein
LNKTNKIELTTSNTANQKNILPISSKAGAVTLDKNIVAESTRQSATIPVAATLMLSPNVSTLCRYTSHRPLICILNQSLVKVGGCFNNR